MGPEEHKQQQAAAPATVQLSGFMRRLIRRRMAKQAKKNPKEAKPVGQVTEIPVAATARQCYECRLPAMYFRFTRSKQGGIDKSSRQPVCSAHAGK